MVCRSLFRFEICVATARLVAAAALSIGATNAVAEERSVVLADSCLPKFAQVGAKFIDFPPLAESATQWSPAGVKQIVALSKRLNGNLSVRDMGRGHVNFEIDLPKPGVSSGTSGYSVRRVRELPQGMGAYEFPRLEVRVRPGENEKEVILVSGQARGIVKDGVANIDDKVSDGLGLRVHIPDNKHGPVVIDGGLSSGKNLLNPDSRLTVVPLLETATELLNAIAPRRTTILRARDGDYRRLPGGKTWERIN